MDPTPNLTYLVSSRLGEDWSAERFQVKPDVLAQLSRETFASLNPLVKCRLILSCLMAASRQQTRSSGPDAAQQAPLGNTQLASQLRRLGEMALQDDDAWVKVMGAAAGDFDGRLDLEALCAANPKVKSTVTHLRELADNSSIGDLYPPLEDLYLAPPSRNAALPSSSQQQHFTLRPAGEVPVRVRARGPPQSRPGHLSPTARSRQGSLMGRRGTSTGEDTAFRPSWTGEHQQPKAQVAYRGVERPGHHPVQPLATSEAARLSAAAAAQHQRQQQAGAAGTGTGTAPKLRLPMQLKRTPQQAGLQQPVVAASVLEEEAAVEEQEERVVYGSSAARLAAWDDDDDDEGGEGLVRAGAVAPQPRMRAAVARSGRLGSGRLPSGRLRPAAVGQWEGVGEQLGSGADLEDEMGSGEDDQGREQRQQQQTGQQQQHEAQMRELFEDDEQDGEATGAAAGAASVAAPPRVVEPTAAGSPAGQGASAAAGTKAKRRRAVISDGEED